MVRVERASGLFGVVLYGGAGHDSWREGWGGWGGTP